MAKDNLIFGIVLLIVGLTVLYIKLDFRTDLEKYEDNYISCMENMIEPEEWYCEKYAADKALLNKDPPTIWLECRKNFDSDYCAEYETKISNEQIGRIKELQNKSEVNE